MKKYNKENLVFSRKESKNEYLIYSAVTRGVHLMPRIVWKFWNNCNNKSIEELQKKLDLSEKEARTILNMLISRKLIK